MVAEPDTLSTISILRGLKERYENHHRFVLKKNEAIIAAVELSNPLHHRAFPARQTIRP